MSVVIETTLGDVTVDLYLNERPRACLNFLKLCKVKYYNFNLFHTISRGFIAQTGDPTGSRTGGESVFGVIDGPSKRYFEAENEPRIKHTRPGLISFVGGDKNMIGSQFFLTLGEDLTYLDEKHCVFGEVVEGVDILEAINEVICDNDNRPYQDVRITHTVVLDDPFPDPKGLLVPTRSPSPSAERLAGGRIAPDEEIDETSGRSVQEIAEMQAEREAKARATILEMVGDIPDAEMAPPENVLFVCKLNPVTTDDDLEIIFSRFGKIKFCEVIRDRKSGDSLQYAFIEFEEQKSCEDAYFKMGNVLIDDRRIHVDFSQSVSKVKWLGKGRGVAHYDEKGNKRMNDANNDVGKGNYKINNGYSNNRRGGQQNDSSRREKRSPDRDSRQRKNSPRRNRNRSRSTTRESHRGRSPQGSGKNSPRRNRNRSRSRTRDSYRGRSPKGNRKSMYSRDRRATDFRRRRSPLPIPRRRSRSPINRKRLSRSPQVSSRRHDRRSSSRNRPRSPRRSSSQNRQKHFSGRRSPIKSKRDASREKSKSVEKYKHSSREKSLLTEKYKEEPIRSHKRSESSENKRSLVHREDSSSKRSSRRSASVQESSSLKNRDSTVSPKRSNKERSSESISKEKPKGKSSTSKKKKSKLDNSSDDSDSDSEEEKLKKKKINESDSSSSSEEEKAKSKSKHHKNKKAVKVKKSKKSKKRRKKHSSSSSGSGSNSSENSSDSSGDRHKPKKKKSKKSSDESD